MLLRRHLLIALLLGMIGAIPATAALRVGAGYFLGTNRNGTVSLGE